MKERKWGKKLNFVISEDNVILTVKSISLLGMSNNFKTLDLSLL